MTDLTTTTSPIVIGGVDTHKDLHVVAVVDVHDRVIGTESFSTTRAGYRALLRWMRSFGDIARVGVECTGSYGAGLGLVKCSGSTAAGTRQRTPPCT